MSEYKGTTMVNLREYYEKDGQSLPGKKGLSLALPQYKALLEAVPGIEVVLSEKGLGQEVPRLRFGAGEGTQDGGGGVDGDQDDDPERDAVDEAKEKKGRVKKENFEATSDEEDIPRPET